MLDWFEDIYDNIGNGWSPVRVSYAEIYAYVSLTGELISASEVYMLRHLSNAYLEVWDQKQRRGKLKSSGVKNLTPMSDSAGIKALFVGRGEDPKRPRKLTQPPAKKRRPK